MTAIVISMRLALCRFLRVPMAICLLLSGTGSMMAHAQESANTAARHAPTVKTVRKIDAKRTWNELSPAQQHALAPLASEWNKLEFVRRQKWLVIGNKFAKLAPAEQERMQERMRDWVKLTPSQRRSVRESYTRAKRLDADKKSAQWQQYQQLSEEQKKKLSQARLPRHVAALPSAKSKTAPSMQLPPDRLEPNLVPPQAIVAPAPDN